MLIISEKMNNYDNLLYAFISNCTDNDNTYSLIREHYTLFETTLKLLYDD